MAHARKLRFLRTVLCSKMTQAARVPRPRCSNVRSSRASSDFKDALLDWRMQQFGYEERSRTNCQIGTLQLRNIKIVLFNNEKRTIISPPPFSFHSKVRSNHYLTLQTAITQNILIHFCSWNVCTKRTCNLRNLPTVLHYYSIKEQCQTPHYSNLWAYHPTRMT